MKKTKLSLLATALLLGGAASLTSCSSKTQLDTPTNISYDVATGKFSFDAIEGAKTYTIGVSEIINETTGKGIAGIQGSAKMKLSDKEVYIWTTQIGSVSGVADTDNDGKVEGKIVFRSFSSSAANPGSPVKATAIPKGDFILTVMADATSSLAGSEYGIYTFSNKGALADPTGFTGTFTEDGKLKITAASKYYINSLSTTGLPENMEFVVKQDGSVLETLSMNDFTYSNTVIGPEKSYNFNNASVTTTKTVDKTKKITATVQVKGNGNSKTDSQICDVMVETTTDAVTYATKYDCSGSGKAGDITINLNVGEDASGNKIFGLEAKSSNVVVARESGTFTASDNATVTDIDGKKTFAEGKVLTFQTSASDLTTKIMDGKSLTVTKKEDFNPWSGTTINWALLGEGFGYNGTTFAFTGAASSGGGFPGGPGPM